MSIGEIIKRLRMEQGMTQQNLADKLDLTKASVASYETNRRKPSLEVVEKLADLFNVSSDYILGRTKFKREEHQETNKKIKQALEDDPELLDFWDDMHKRDDIKLMFKQTKDMSPESVKSVVQFMKSVEDEHKKHDNF